MAKIGKLFLDFEAGTAKFNDPIRRAKKELSLFGRVAVTSQKGFKGLNSGFNSMAIKAAAAIAAIVALKRALTGVVKPSADLEESLNRVSSIMGGLEGSAYDRIKQKARDLGRSTEFTAGQVADGFRLLAMAGLDAEQSISAIGPALDLASAGGIGLAESADNVTNIMGQFGLQAKDTSRAVDVLAKAASSSNTDVMEMAEAFKFLGPTARALGVDLEESAAVIGALADSGLKAGIGTRSLSTALVNLTNAQTGRKLKSVLGVEAFNEGKFIGIINLVEELNKAFEGLTDQARAGLITQIFGAGAFQEMDVLLTRGADGLRELEARFDGARGAARKMAEENLKGLNGQMKKLNSAFQDVLISLGEAGLTKLLTETALKFTTLFSSMSESKNVFGSFVKLVEFLKKAFSAVSFEIKFFVVIMVGLAKAFNFLKGVIGGVMKTVSIELVNAFRVSANQIRAAYDFLASGVLKSIRIVIIGVAKLIEGFSKINKLPFVDIDVEPALESIRRVQDSLEKNLNNREVAITMKPEIDPADKVDSEAIVDNFIKDFNKFLANGKAGIEMEWSKIGDSLQEKLASAAKEGVEALREEVKDLVQSGEIQQLTNQTDKLRDSWRKVGVSIEDVLVEGAIQMKSFGDIVANVMAKIREDIIRNFLQGKQDEAGNRSGGLLDSIFNSGGGGGKTSGSGGSSGGWLSAIGKIFGGFFANGGNVKGGEPIVVGERGPELFTPGMSGSITPNNRMGMGGSNVTTVNQYNTFDIRGSEREVQRMIARSVETSVNLAIAQNQNLKNRGAIT